MVTGPAPGREHGGVRLTAEREREVLHPIVFGDLPPGTDRPSAIWGATQALILLRATAREQTLPNHVTVPGRTLAEDITRHPEEPRP